MSNCAVDHDLRWYDKQECLNDEWMTVLDQKVDDKMKEVFSGENKELYFDVVQNLEYDAMDKYDGFVHYMMSAKNPDDLMRIKQDFVEFLKPIFEKNITENIEKSKQDIFAGRFEL